MGRIGFGTFVFASNGNEIANKHRAPRITQPKNQTR